MDGLGLTRRELLWQTGLWLGPDNERTRAQGRADDPQVALAFEDPDAAHPFAPLNERDRIVADYRMLRFSTGEHPLALVRDRMEPGVLSSRELPDTPDRQTITVVGVVVARQRPHTARGYLFVLVEDEFGHINVIVKPEVYERHRAVLRMEPFLQVRGRLQKDGASLNVIASSVQELRVARGSAPELPGTQEYWPDPKRRHPGEGADPEAFAFLTTLRQTPPDTKSWG